MGFCPLCGKQLPPNGICSCRSNMNENAAQGMVQPQAPNGYQQQGQPQMQQQQQMPPQQQMPQGNGYPQPGVQQPGAQQPMYVFMQNPQTPQPIYMVKMPSGPNAFSEAFKAFGDCFIHPGTASHGVLDGKIPVGSGFVLMGMFFLISWLSMMLCFLGRKFNFGPSLGWGALLAAIFVIVKFIPAAFICAFREKKEVDYVKILSATFIGTAWLDCVLILMSLFQFATTYFMEFFLVMYFGIVFYQNMSIERALSENQNPNKQFWCNLVLTSGYALVYLLIQLLIYKAIFKA